MSKLDDFFERVKTIIFHYGITFENRPSKFCRIKDTEVYYIDASSGIIFIEFNNTTGEGLIQFNKMFQCIRHNSGLFNFEVNSPLLHRFRDCYLLDREIFNAYVTQHDDEWTLKSSYGSLLDLMDISLVFKMTAETTATMTEHDFVVRYHTNQSCSKLLMLDTVSYLSFENKYDFYYKDGKIIYDGDYQKLHEDISTAYHLNDSDLKFKNFKDLAQLTLMKIY